MAWKNLKQLSLADSMVVTHEAVKELDELDELIDWSRVEQHLSHLHAKSHGEKACPLLFMFKALLLQIWYNLSYPQLEKQLARDLLFRRFVELDLFESNAIQLEPPMRKSQKESKVFPALFGRARKRIGTFFSQLRDQFMVRRNYAKSFAGSARRLTTKIATLTFIQWDNVRRGNKINNIKVLLS